MSKLTSILSALSLASGCVSLPAIAQAPQSTSSLLLSTTDTLLGTLLDNPAAHAVLMKYIPQIVQNPQIDMGRGMTLKQLQSYAGDVLTDDVLAKIDIELKQIPLK